MNRKISKLLQPSVQLYFVILILFALASALFSIPLAVLEAVVVLILGLYTRTSGHKRRREITKYIENITGNVDVATKDTMVNDSSRYNAQNTFDELLNLGAIPIVNENDTVSTSEIPYVDSFGDNDRLSAIVAALIGADLLILLSDIDGLYSDDPRSNPDARFISLVPEITPEFLGMGKATSGSDVGTGGMSAKLAAARIATDSGADMVIANGDQVEVILDIMAGKEKGTLFLAHPNLDFDLMHYLNNEY